ncbi:hypothetical protein ACCT30_44085, partial [Rhizobium ruizarguesonis]
MIDSLSRSGKLLDLGRELVRYPLIPGIGRMEFVIPFIRRDDAPAINVMEPCNSKGDCTCDDRSFQ